ncbi:MAG: sulfatase [Magnetococcales bacterium]|nr:sulfatase [Magnetococcales bacterium]
MINLDGRRSLVAIATFVVALTAAACLFLLSWGRVLECAIEDAATPSGRANLLFLTLDTARADHLSLYGYDRETSPNLARMARDGFVFDRAYTVSTNSAPSHASMFTGLYPRQHGLENNGEVLSERNLTLAERLARDDYRTAGFVGYHALGRDSGLDQGFQTFAHHEVPSHDHDRDAMVVDRRGFDAAMRWVDAWGEAGDRRRPFFMWFHFQNIHESYDPPPPYDGLFLDIPRTKTRPGLGAFDVRCIDDIWTAFKRDRLRDPHVIREIIALYDGEIRFVDDMIGTFMEKLRALGAYDDTVIVAMADHGEILFDYGYRNGVKVMPGHTGHYFEPSARIPLVIKPARGSSPPVTGRIDLLTSSVDLFPTVLDLLNLPVEKPVPGISLRPWMSNTPPVRSRRAVFFQDRPDKEIFVGVRTDRWKLIRRQGSENDPVGWTLYDMREDPRETRNLWLERPEVGRHLASRLTAWEGGLTPIDFASTRRAPDERMRRALKEAGYLRE